MCGWIDDPQCMNNLQLFILREFSVGSVLLDYFFEEYDDGKFWFWEISKNLFLKAIKFFE